MRVVQRYQRIALALGVVVIVGLVILWWSASQRPGASVSLSFVGFTNHSRLVTISGLQPRQGTITISAAALLVTNSGSVAVTMRASMRGNIFQRHSDGTLKAPEGFAFPESAGLPRLLQPGESVLVLANAGTREGAWWTEFSYQRTGIRERLYGRIWEVASPALQRSLTRLYDPFKMYHVRYEHPTNVPPNHVSRNWKEAAVHKIEWTPPTEIDWKPSDLRPSPSLLDGGIYR